MNRIVLDQSKIRISEELVSRGAPSFPRSLAWWRRNVPGWLDVSLDGNGHVVLEPNGWRADGAVLEVTPALRRRRITAARAWVDNQTFLNFTDAIVTAAS
ncbi:hypothetical protein OG384_04360 [Streptomyces sp. NBC_01324]|uniref:hypothetical protein n=1 Tax=Streptomyces sp. NBC_01324 TaxID=2903826 RepID=UPI002E121E47|nr:hypothetical protein OG384_04360 [Streptomyces sp. NBC_01324]